MTKPTQPAVLTLNSLSSESGLPSALASAFSTDPLFRYPFGKDVPHDFEKRLEPLFANIIRHTLQGNSKVHYSSDENSVAVWFYDDSFNNLLSLPALQLFIAATKCYGWKLFKFINIVERINRHQPKVPHAYLSVLGTHSDSRGRGLGGTVISKFLAECDEKGLPAYLESSNKRNIPFYERHGFVVQEELPGLPDDCPPITIMWREARDSRRSQG